MFLFLFFRCMIIYATMIVTIIIIMLLDAIGYINWFFVKKIPVHCFLYHC